MKRRSQWGKKIADKVGSVLKSEGDLFPYQYAIYRFCLEFRCMPNQVMDMKDSDYHLFREFMHQEAEAGRIQSKRSKQRNYGN